MNSKLVYFSEKFRKEKVEIEGFDGDPALKAYSMVFFNFLIGIE
jgi:hypothetical protein